MMRYTVLEQNTEDIFETDKAYTLHRFGDWVDGKWYEETIEDAKQGLSVKEGIDLVEWENGHIGFIAYYNDKADCIEVVPDDEIIDDVAIYEDDYLVADANPSDIGGAMSFAELMDIINDDAELEGQTIREYVNEQYDSMRSDNFIIKTEDGHYRLTHFC